MSSKDSFKRANTVDIPDMTSLLLSNEQRGSSFIGQSDIDHVEGHRPPTAKVAPLVGTHPHRQTTPTIESQRSYVQKGISSKLIKEGGGGTQSDKLKHLLSLLTEKSQIIEKQKHTITSLQTECKDKDTQLRLLNLPQCDSTLSAPVRLDILSKKLDEAYYELERVKSDGDLTQEKLTDKEKEANELEHNIDKLKTINQTLEEKISKLEGYLGNTPTMEEHYSLKEQLTGLHSQVITLTDKIKERDEKIHSLNKELKDKEVTLSDQMIKLNELKQNKIELEVQCQSSDRRIVELHSDNSQLKIEIQKLRQSINDQEVSSKQDLRDMRERHKLRFMEATAKLKDQYRTVTKRNRQLELQLMKSSDVMTALNSELKLSQGTVADLKSSIGDLVKQNQELMEKNYGLREPFDSIKGITSCSPVSDSSDDTSLQLLNQEMTHCVEEVESLVSLASSVLEGRDPNMSNLLGVPGGGGATNKVTSSQLIKSDTIDSEMIESERRYEQQLLQVQRNRQEIERLREIIADHFASQVANECHVQ